MSIDTSTFYLIHSSGDKLYPYQLKNRETRELAFRVAAPGKRDAHGLSQELTDISEVMSLVVEHGYSVRAKSLVDSARHGSYRLTGREITGWARVQTLE